MWFTKNCQLVSLLYPYLKFLLTKLAKHLWLVLYTDVNYLKNLFIKCTKIEQLSYWLLLITINFEDINNPCQLLVLSWLTSYGGCFDLKVYLWSCKLTISYVKKISKLDFYNFLPSAFIWKVNIVPYQLKLTTSLQLSYHRTLSQS